MTSRANGRVLQILANMSKTRNASNLTLVGAPVTLGFLESPAANVSANLSLPIPSSFLDALDDVQRAATTGNSNGRRRRRALLQQQEDAAGLASQDMLLEMLKAIVNASYLGSNATQWAVLPAQWCTLDTEGASIECVLSPEFLAANGAETIFANLVWSDDISALYANIAQRVNPATTAAASLATTTTTAAAATQTTTPAPPKKEEEEGLSGAAIAGIIVGAVAGAGLIGAGIYFLVEANNGSVAAAATNTILPVKAAMTTYAKMVDKAGVGYDYVQVPVLEADMDTFFSKNVY